MAGMKSRFVRIELAFCVLVPVAALALIAIPGYRHVHQLKREVALRSVLLDEIPLQERRLVQAGKTLAPFRSKNGGKDKSGELALQVSQAGTERGLTVKSVNSDKVVPVSTPAFLEHKIAMAGEGELGVLIRTFDDLDRPNQCLKVVSMRMRAKAFMPQPVYDVETVFISDTLVAHGVSASPLAGDLTARLDRLSEGAGALAARVGARKPALDTRKIDRKKAAVKEYVAPVIPDEAVGFKLNGIIRDGRDPLALTDRGLFGVGDSIDGYRITKMGADYIEVVGRQGRKETILLYRTEAKP